MRVETNKRTDAPNFKIEDSDSMGITHLRQMIAGKYTCVKCGTENENFSWRTLQGYLSSLRLWIEELGKSHAQSRAKKDLCSNDLSILTGIDLAIGLPQKLIFQSDVMDKIQTERIKEAHNDAGTDDSNGYGD